MANSGINQLTYMIDNLVDFCLGCDWSGSQICLTHANIINKNSIVWDRQVLGVVKVARKII